MPSFFRRHRRPEDLVAEARQEQSGPGAVVVRDGALPATGPSSDRTRTLELAVEGVVLDGRYRLGPPLGAGGTATVHRARDLVLGRDVAIKVFRTRALSPEELQAQEAEARVAAALNHFALTALFDAGVEADADGGLRVYLVMELVDGVDLRERLRSGTLTAVEAAWLGFELADALDYVHRAGFVHRDVKPANVLLSDVSRARPMVGKLADFGIATAAGQPDPSEYTVGTAAYISPEQVRGEDARPESDVYSLGLVLLEALTGQVEFPGAVVESAFARLDRSPAVPGWVPPALAEVLRGMTALRPEDRLPLPAVATALQRFLVDESVRLRQLDPALIDSDEADRVAAVRRYDILDTEPDEAFDAITRLVSRILDVPIALVTLVDMNRVWFKSSFGWDEQQVDRDIAFCSTTNPGTNRPWTVSDALDDARTRENPLVVAGPMVRSYAGAPLTTRDGYFLGALCAFDREARDFSPQQLDSLADLAGLVMHELELRRAVRRALYSEL